MIYATHALSNLVLIIKLMFFLYSVMKIEKRDKEDSLFLTRFIIMLPMIVLSKNFRRPETIETNAILVLIILSGIAYDLFWRQRERYQTGK